MSLRTEGNEELDVYYQRQEDEQLYTGNCNDSTKVKCCKFTPYTYHENINYIYRMLVLPGLITTIVIVLVIMGVYQNLIIGIISGIITYIGSLFLSIYIREQNRESNFEIPESDQLPSGEDLNVLKEVKLKIGFVGDIMRMRDHKLTFSEDIETFFSDVKIVVGNLEGIVTDKKCKLTKQAHPKEILKPLQELLRDNTKWLLCLCNNHSLDFGNEEFHKSLHIIRRESKIDVFGRNDVTNVFVEGEDINISTASEWSNQKTWDCISRFSDTNVDPYYSQNKFNIFYPHWGFENERYVRTNIQDNARALLTGNNNEKLDLIFGHHPHVRQPIMVVREELKDQNGVQILDRQGNRLVLKKFVAFSGGNFTSGVTFWRRKKHIHGIILKCDIGPLEDYTNQLAVGRVDWEYTVNRIDNNEEEPTKIVEYGEEVGYSRTSLLIMSIVIIAVFILLKILDFFL